MTARLEPCCTTCLRCRRPFCRDDDPSPLEDERICGGCVTAEEAEAVIAS